MDSPTPDAPDSENAPEVPPADVTPGDESADTPQDDSRTDVKPRQEEPDKQTPPEKGKREKPEPEPSPPEPAKGDVLIYRGTVSLWLGWRSFATAIGAAILGLTLLIAGLVYQGWLKNLGIYVGLPLFVAAALMCGYVFLSLRCLRYKITDRLIERERGILVKRVDRLDLARVKDVQLVQNLMERILRIGTIEILSSDRTDPLMRIEAIPKSRAVYEKLSDTVIKFSQKRGIIAMDR
jgi:membrane protein YdbS with pleckstrin-like domain